MRFFIKTFINVSLGLLVFTFFFIPTSKIFASTTDNVFGSAWSYNVGWINFNSCTDPTNNSTCGAYDYGVNIDHNNNDIISGYAWSDNIGWISFNPTDWGSCPPTTGCTGNGSTFSNKWTATSNGWARALSVVGSNNAGGWDGWISLNNSSPSWPASSSTNGTFSGYLWGSDVVGWVELSGLSVINSNIASIILTSNKVIISAGDKVNFHWEAKNFTPTSCVGLGETGATNQPFGDWKQTFSVSATSGDKNGIYVKYDTTNTLNTVTKFILECTDANNVKKQGNVSITVSPLTLTLTRYSSSCVSPSVVGVELIGSSNSTNATSCKLLADNTSSLTSSSFVETYRISPVTSLSSIIDDQFDHKSTRYKLQCDSGASSFQSAITASSNIKTVTTCVPTYTIVPGSYCSGLGYGVNLKRVPAIQPLLEDTYVGSVNLKINRLYSYDNDVDLLFSKTNNFGTLTFYPGQTFEDGVNDDIVTITLSLTGTQYLAAIANALIPYIPGPGQETPSTDILSSLSLTSTPPPPANSSFSIPTINFCIVDPNAKIKPIYKPF